ncbi:Gryzun, putative trafficking through golgi-domain-containing protein [Suillus clintonianus]|uniref:Gryzun, putative trafficking through golgi-domain-containing protein n=1 Tax=Suillus clintonianus TaxID=1904413 RepID=UPI001B88678D|nr:Gryzun, putative trafficking through golgi-domain-containing protein [Suillus clintonianus]KAG2153198.1 Gryzun, putative trafficking through golgi-domain-containing protein [Suillus clintonianus]
MNSYPAELLVQLAPVMFVAGLDLPPAPSASTPSTPQSPGQAQSPPPTPTKTQDPFGSLVARLRDALQSQRKVAIWAPERTRAFHMILVGKDVRFPPRKLVPPEDPAYTSVHSPLSPMTPSSPLYPDGLIAPIWIRKHTALVPSVFVQFLRLFESPVVHARSPLDPPDPEHERDKAEEERRRDIELSAEVAARKKTTNERGIKLTVVLLATRRMLDDPSLDSRLTFIRRQSGLDSRAALFVLSPVSTSELNDFARSLQDALYEPALEYYTSHSKRVRRKRNRHSQSVSSYNPPPLASMGAASTRPLRPEGWTVRYEYKMACFAEFRGEDEVALKHYQDAYATLMIMFGSTAILPPRTKRWAEAKVLADAINVKITKLYLYNHEHSLALSHHNSHMRRFADFSRGWGIGEETFEYWSWMARQHRVLAELLEQGSNSSLTFPTNSPHSLTAGMSSTSTPVELDTVRALGLNPSHALQHPGHYYFMAARCTEARRDRFLANEGISQGTSGAPGYANEKKVDHLTLILELYTKSYEMFKKYSSTTSQGRLTLWIAYRIAHTYYESEKFDVAIRFFERIAKTYRREKWKNMLRPLLSTWYACAQKLSDVELMVTLLVEMIGYAQDVDESRTLQEDLLAVLESSVPVSTGNSLVVDLKESDPLLDTMLVFWTPEVRVGEEAGFQLSLATPTNIDLSALPIDSVIITFSNGYYPVILRHSPPTDGQVADTVVRLVKIGKVVPEDEDEEPEEICADLRWKPGERLVVSGSISSEAPGPLTVVSITVVLAQNGWNIEIPHEPCISHEISTLVPRWLTSLQPIQFLQLGRSDCSSVIVRHRPHELAVSLSHQAPALVDEEYPIVIDITNVDERHLDVVVDVLLQPTEVDQGAQYIIFDDQRSSGLIKGIRLGTIAPGVSATKTLYLVGSGAPGDRMLDISIQSTSIQPVSMSKGDDDAEPRNSSSLGAHATVDSCEKLQTIVIPTSGALAVTYDVAYSRSKNAIPALADLSTVEDDFWDDSYGGECSAPCGLVIESLKLHRQDNPLAKVLDCSSDESSDDMFPGEYLPGDELYNVSRVSLNPREEQVLGEEKITGPGEYEVVWRRMLPEGGCGRQSITRFALPTLMISQEGLIALLDIPSFAKLHVSTPIHLTVRNRHSSRSANVTVSLDLDPSDAFIVAGLRNGRLPILLPGSEEKLSWNLIPIECGHVKVPRIKVMDVRGVALPSQGVGVPSTEIEVEGEAVKVVDVRANWNTASAQGAGDSAVAIPQQDGASTILVLP